MKIRMIVVDKDGQLKHKLPSGHMESVPRIKEEILRNETLYRVNRVVYDLELNYPEAHLELMEIDQWNN